MKPRQNLYLRWSPRKPAQVRVVPGDDLVRNDATLAFTVSLSDLDDPEAIETLTYFYDWPPIPFDDWENRLKVDLVANLYVPDEARTQVAVLQVGLLSGALTVGDFLQGLEGIVC